MGVGAMTLLLTIFLIAALSMRDYRRAVLGWPRWNVQEQFLCRLRFELFSWFIIFIKSSLEKLVMVVGSASLFGAWSSLITSSSVTRASSSGSSTMLFFPLTIACTVLQSSSKLVQCCRVLQSSMVTTLQVIQLRSNKSFSLRSVPQTISMIFKKFSKTAQKPLVYLV